MPDLTTVDFKDIYCTDEAASLQPERYADAVKSFSDAFGSREVQAVFSAPGRTEIGGNHTDHQHGEVLAASINKDAIAVVSCNGSDSVNVLADGFGLISIDINDLDIREQEKGTTAALIRGVLAGLKTEGCILGGFDAYSTSDVLIGAGLSSSDAFETLIGTVVSGLFNDMKIDPVTIAKVGQFAENKYFGKPCGLMDQMACSVGNLVHIDFEDTGNPAVDKIDFDFSKTDYVLCITDTKGSHADLTNEYAAVPLEMKKIASLLGYDVLRPVSFEDIIENISMLREKAGDRAVLRAIHFVNETLRAQDEAEALKQHLFQVNTDPKVMDQIRHGKHPEQIALQKEQQSRKTRSFSLRPAPPGAPRPLSPCCWDSWKNTTCSTPSLSSFLWEPATAPRVISTRPRPLAYG
jgi:galactokinase